MPIPDLNEHGLLPAGRHACTLDEISERFCQTEERKKIFDGLSVACAAIKAEFDGTIYVDGSFVTDKPNPSDVDIVLDLPEAVGFSRSRAFRFHRDNFQIYKKDLLVDFLLNLPQLDHVPAGTFVEFISQVGIKIGSAKGLPPDFQKGILVLT